MIARPTAASAAATAIVKSTNPSPYMVLVSRANATRLRLTAFIISSTHMNMMIKLRRTRTPISPMTKSAALRKRKWLVVSSVIGAIVPQVSGCRGGVNPGALSPRHPVTPVRLPAPNSRVQIRVSNQDDLARCLECSSGLLIGAGDGRSGRWSLRQCHVRTTGMTEGDRAESLAQPLRQGENNGPHDPDQEDQRDHFKGEQVLREQDIAEGLGAAADEQDVLRCRIASRATYGPVGDRCPHLEKQDDTQERTDDPLHRMSAAALGKLLGIDQH